MEPASIDDAVAFDTAVTRFLIQFVNAKASAGDSKEEAAAPKLLDSGLDGPLRQQLGEYVLERVDRHWLVEDRSRLEGQARLRIERGLCERHESIEGAFVHEGAANLEQAVAAQHVGHTLDGERNAVHRLD